MADRSGFWRARCAAALLVVAASAGGGAAAGAATQTDGQVVAGPTEHGAAVRAYVRGGLLCARVVEPVAAQPGPDVGSSPEWDCPDVPVLGPFGHQEFFGGIGGDRFADGGVTGTDVAAVELRRDGRVVAHAPTVPSPLPGAAGELRFFVVEGTTADAPDEVAYLDAAGAVRRATDIAVGAALPGAGPTIPRGPSRVVAHGRRGAGVRWTLSAYVQRPLAPTPLQPERRVALPCLSLDVTSGGERSSQDDCDAVGREDEPLLELSGKGCGSLGRYAGGLVRPAVRRLVAVLGDGTRRPIALVDVPGVPASGTRAGLAVLGTGVALRRLEAFDAAGRRIASTPSQAPVAPRRCRNGSSASFLNLVSGAHGLPRAPLGPGPHTPVAADSGARICLAVDRAPRPGADCAAAPVEEDDARLDTEPTAGGGRYVAGFVPPSIAGARLTLDDGTTRDAAAVPIPGYTGQYAGLLRLVAADVPGPRRVVAYSLRDARGRTLVVRTGPDQPPLRTVARLGTLPGFGALRAAALPPQTGVPGLCLALGVTPSLDTTAGCRVGLAGYTEVAAPCAPRRIAIFGVLAHRHDRLAVALAGGRVVTGRTLGLPAALRRHGIAAVGVVVLRAGDAPRTLIRRGRAARRTPLVLPPVGRQCGYRTVADLHGPPGFD